MFNKIILFFIGVGLFGCKDNHNEYSYIELIMNEMQAPDCPPLKRVDEKGSFGINGSRCEFDAVEEVFKIDFDNFKFWRNDKTVDISQYGFESVKSLVIFMRRGRVLSSDPGVSKIFSWFGGGEISFVYGDGILVVVESVGRVADCVTVFVEDGEVFRLESYDSLDGMEQRLGHYIICNFNKLPK